MVPSVLTTEFLSPSDAFIWSVDRDPRLRSTIVTMTLLGATPDWDHVLRQFDRLSRALPALRRCVVSSPPPAPPRWREDADFDLTFHVRNITAAAPGSLDTVLDLARVMAMDDFDRARPLWEVIVVEGLERGHAALLCKVHHALTDGVGAIALASKIFGADFVPKRALGADLPTDPVVEAETAGITGALTAVAQTVPRLAVTATLHPLRTLTTTLSTGMSFVRIVRPSVGPRSPIMRRRSLSRRLGTVEVSRPALHRAGEVGGGSLNDAFLAAVAEGVRLYHAKHSAPVDDLLLSMPVNIRREGDPPGGNRTTLLRFDLPCGIRDAADRIRSVHERTAAARHERSLSYASVAAAAMNLAPHQYVSSVLRRVDVLASDVPGFTTPMLFAGVPVLALYAFPPTLGAAFNVTLVSYIDTCAVGLNVDVGAIPDFDVFHTCITAGFDDVLALAS